MKVAELIAQLQAMPQDLQVVCFNDDYELAPLELGPRVQSVFTFADLCSKRTNARGDC